MRTDDEYREIMALWAMGVNKKAISRQTGIPRATVRDCINRFVSGEELEKYLDEHNSPILITLLQDDDSLLLTHAPSNGSGTGLHANRDDVHKAYSYLFGLYLGDVSINLVRRVYRIRITLDAKYPGIIASCTQALQTLLPTNQIGHVKNYYQGKLSYIDVSCFYKHWTAVFPQHAIGKKHERRIQLETWQQQIVNKYPLEFWRGLYHSDGSRFSNVVKGTDYPRYSFTNASDDIIELFTNTCDQLGIHWTRKERRAHAGLKTLDIFISKRKDVEWLDREVGPTR